MRLYLKKIKNCFLLTLSLLLVNCNVFAETKEFDASKIKSIEIEAPKGEISIFAKNDNKIRVVVDKIQFDPKCKLSFTEEGSSLKISISQENLIFDKVTCLSKLSVVTPKETVVKISTGTSTTKIEGITGEINFKSATGSLTALNLESNLSATTATGAVNLKYHTCNQRADIDILTASSDSEIVLPVNCKIKVSHKSASGELYNEIGETSDYKMMIKVKSASGNLKILKTKKI